MSGNRTRLTYSDGNYIDYTFDALNRMGEARPNGGSYIAKFSYDDLGRETLINRGNGTTTTSTYNGTSLSWTLAQDVAGTAQDVQFDLSFTPAPQLHARTISNSSYAYGTTASTTNYSPNGLNQYAAVGGTGFSYDGRGNFTSDGSRSMAYDLENHLTSVSGSASMTLAYDPKGRLHQTGASTDTVFLYDGDSLVEELDASGTPNILRRYIPGNSVDDTLGWYEGGGLGTPNWLHADEQGAVIATTDSSGTATPYAYSVTGESKGGWSASAPAFRYTGQVAIASAAIYYYKARMYDPRLGRFLQTDPIGYVSDYNLYAYVGNDPINRVDPTGLAFESEFGCLTRFAHCGGGSSGGSAQSGSSGTNGEQSVQVAQAAMGLCVLGPEGCAVGAGITAGQAILGGTATGGAIILMNKIPKDAKDPNGAKAPGKPGADEGFKDPKDGERWVKNPNGRGSGWLDDKGRVWVPSGQGGSAHGGPQWDVQTPGGGYDNVYPGGKVRSGG